MSQHHASLEDPFQRNAALGYDPPSEIAGLLRYVSHGTPSPLIRWHYHEDYELHLVVATSGEVVTGWRRRSSSRARSTRIRPKPSCVLIGRNTRGARVL